MDKDLILPKEDNLVTNEDQSERIKEKFVLLAISPIHGAFNALGQGFTMGNDLEEVAYVLDGVDDIEIVPDLVIKADDMASIESKFNEETKVRVFFKEEDKAKVKIVYSGPSERITSVKRSLAPRFAD